MKKPELLAPAGNWEKLVFAVEYGADAVYLGGSDFGLRAQAGNFSDEELIKALEYTKKKQVKLYVAVNIYAHQEDLNILPAYLEKLEKLQVDGLIIADLGVLELAKKYAPSIPIHISTQANVTNHLAAKTWEKLGASRIVLARELGEKECQEISQNINIETEIFIHGAMCMAYSGRCLISSYMADRSANKGDCSQPCRWHYRLEESKRPGQYFPIDEDERGSYIFNSKDLCLIDFIPQIINAGVSSLKIEGRMKSIYYVANIVRIYRQALDAAFEIIKNNKPIENYKVLPVWQDELEAVSYREYTTGFWQNKADEESMRYHAGGYCRSYDFAGIVKEYDVNTNRALVEQRNNLAAGDTIDIISPSGRQFSLELADMWDENGMPIDVAPHPQQLFYLYSKQPLEPYSIIRRKVR